MRLAPVRSCKRPRELPRKARGTKGYILITWKTRNDYVIGKDYSCFFLTLSRAGHANPVRGHKVVPVFARPDLASPGDATDSGDAAEGRTIDATVVGVAATALLEVVLPDNES